MQINQNLKETSTSFYLVDSTMFQLELITHSSFKKKNHWRTFFSSSSCVESIFHLPLSSVSNSLLFIVKEKNF